MGRLKYRFQLPVFTSIMSNVKCINTSGSREKPAITLLYEYATSVSCLAKRMSFSKPLPSKLRLKCVAALLAFKGWEILPSPKNPTYSAAAQSSA